MDEQLLCILQTDHADCMMVMYGISRMMLLTFVGFTEHVGSLVLTSSPMTATDGELFTLICSRNTTGGQDRQWKRDGTFVLITTQGSSSPSVANPDIFNRYLSGRVNVSCDATQHNVTLRINSAVDNGSRWQCVDNVASQTSNTMAIYVTVPQSTHSASVSTVSTTTTSSSSSASTVPPDVTVPQSTHSASVSTVSTTTTTASSSSASTVPPGDTSMSISTSPVTTTKQCPACVTSPSGVYVAAGTVGGAVFGSVVTVVVVALWTHNKNKTKDAPNTNVYASTSAYDYVDHQYAMAPRQYVNTVEGAQTPHYVNTDRDTGDTAYYNTTQ
ncbi:chitinase 3-like isoform X2 [Haliotis rubra]|uniref:chitinase 3-like isoform X2 n=1 Tax=Haliotis rubra TaxID=36100 RepID=UPI001EE4EE30|nr:chitinase 3-like isoform X2 [Haliotis rubra]